MPGAHGRKLRVAAPDFSRGACVDDKPERWDGEERDSPDVKYAKRICRHCPIRKECEQWGTSFDAHGIWGGYTHKERKSRQLANIP